MKLYIVEHKNKYNDDIFYSQPFTVLKFAKQYMKDAACFNYYNKYINNIFELDTSDLKVVESKIMIDIEKNIDCYIKVLKRVIERGGWDYKSEDVLNLLENIKTKEIIITDEDIEEIERKAEEKVKEFLKSFDAIFEMVKKF